MCSVTEPAEVTLRAELLTRQKRRDLMGWAVLLLTGSLVLLVSLLAVAHLWVMRGG